MSAAISAGCTRNIKWLPAKESARKGSDKGKDLELSGSTEAPPARGVAFAKSRSNPSIANVHRWPTIAGRRVTVASAFSAEEEEK